MRKILPLAAAVAAALVLGACDKTGANSAYINSGQSATAAMPAEPLSAPALSPPEQAAPPPETAAAPAPVPTQPPEALTDEAITSRIQLALRDDPAMQGADVSINTANGVVVLSGVVRSHEQTGIASAHAQSQDGVTRVDNNLKPGVS